ncbi:4a-hydroxytetrahydrobiopterin dehydratase [uncultured Salinisphaera sp.]|uniref:4a-hydroxytetrahydrobiopterin dehydratase n=1 Tax=uncultured Salinisphaera sp. TaxID=359372 RepID=UPI0032B27BC5
MSDLSQQHCQACDSSTPALSAEQAESALSQLAARWTRVNDARLAAEFKFKNYGKTQAFVNAVAYIAHREMHHPEITFGYNQCRVELTTHAIGGLSENDFIFAAKVDRLVDD